MRLQGYRAPSCSKVCAYERNVSDDGKHFLIQSALSCSKAFLLSESARLEFAAKCGLNLQTVMLLLIIIDCYLPKTRLHGRSFSHESKE